MSISEVLFCLLLAGLQIFVSLRLLGRDTTWWKVASLTLLHASSIVLFSRILPHTALRFLAISATYFVYYIWIFSADLFPDALAFYLTGLALQALGELVFDPLFRLLQKDPSQTTVLLRLSPYLPLFILLFFVTRDWRKIGNKERRRSVELSSVIWLMVYGIFAVIYFLVCRVGESKFRDFFLGGSLVAMPLTYYAVHQYIAQGEKTGKSLQYHVKQHSIQKSALKALREERHEFINELTLISTYLQMGKYEEAMACIDYSSAKLADRNNYATLPHDAWLTVLELKQREAKHRQIAFRVYVQAEAPSSFKEQRLLPKLIINLVDNAFNAVSDQTDGQVSLSWVITPSDKRILAVRNNGPAISSWDGKMMFRGGVTTRKDTSGNHGWGLVICKDIARELRGTLTYESSREQTIFTLTLPPAQKELYPQLTTTS